MPSVPDSNNASHVPTWMSMAKSAGAYAAYRTMRYVDNPGGGEDLYYENNLQGTYEQQVLNDNPMLWWELYLSGVISTVSDSSPNGVVGLIAGGAVDPTDDGPLDLRTNTDRAAEKLGWQIRSSGGTIVLRAEAASYPQLAAITFPFTMECWFQTSSHRENPHLKLHGDTTYTLGSGQGFYSLPTVSTLDDAGPPTEVKLTIPNALTPDDAQRMWTGVRRHATELLDPGFGDNQWHHMVGVWAAGKQMLYVDGMYAGEGAITGANAIAPNDSVGAVRIATGPSYRGNLANIALYDHGLSRTQIRDHYIAGSKCLDLKLATGYPAVTHKALSTNRGDTGLLLGDRTGQAMVITPAYDGNETDELAEASLATAEQPGGSDAYHGLWSRPERDAIMESEGSFGIIAGLKPTIHTDGSSGDFLQGDAVGRYIFDNRHTGEATDTGTIHPNNHHSSGFSLRLNKTGYLMLRYKSSDEFVESNNDVEAEENPPVKIGQVASGGSGGFNASGWDPHTFVTAFATTGGVGVYDETTVTLMNGLEVAKTLTSQDDPTWYHSPDTIDQHIDWAERPVLGYATTDGLADDPSSPNEAENWDGSIGPLILFASRSMTVIKAQQIIQAIKGNYWPARNSFHAARGGRRWYRLIAPSRP